MELSEMPCSEEFGTIENVFEEDMWPNWKLWELVLISRMLLDLVAIYMPLVARQYPRFMCF